MTKLHYEAIEIRHEPDGKLIAFISSPPFEQQTVVNLIARILQGSNNFSVRGVNTSQTHTNFDNLIEIWRRNE